MADESIEIRPPIRMQRNRKNKDAIVLEHPAQLVEDPSVVLSVFDHVKGADQIESALAEWQRADVASGGDSAARPQALDHHRTHVDEMRAGNRQPGTQARSELEARRRTRQEL